jgi:hypothetical protein
MSSCSVAPGSSSRSLAVLLSLLRASAASAALWTIGSPALALLATLFLASPAVAEVKYFPKTGSAPATISVTGDITANDIEAFANALDAIPAKDEAYVRLDSTGGYALAGIAIGDLVRNSGMKTWVDDNVICSSACGAIWIAGSRKWAGANSHIGFHGAYSPQSGLASPVIMALLGAHYGYLGYGAKTIIWLVSGRPLDMHWLTPDLATMYGIDFEYDKSKTPPGPPPIPAQPANKEPPPTQARKYATYTTIINLTLRSAPDPYAAPIMDYPIPEGEKVYRWLDENCQWWLGSGRGNIDADNLWCPVSYGNNKGWANGAFLQRPDGIIVGCADNPRRNGCPSRNDGASNLWNMWR